MRFENTERRNKETSKLLTTIQADRTYILESGADTNFSKCLLTAFASLTPEQLYSPVTLQPQPGKDESVLFCRVWVDSELIMASYNEKTNWREISKQAKACVNAASKMVL